MPTYTVWTSEPKRLGTLDWDTFPASLSPAMAGASVCQLTGSRDIVDRDAVYAILDEAYPDPTRVIVVTGDARGWDTLGKEWGVARKVLRIVKFPADWKGQGKGAGPKRNQQMVDFSLHMKSLGLPVAVIAGIQPNSKGTADMLRRCTKAGLRGVTVPFPAKAAA